MIFFGKLNRICNKSGMSCKVVTPLRPHLRDIAPYTRIMISSSGSLSQTRRCLKCLEHCSVHWVASQYPQKGSKLLEMPKCVLSNFISHRCFKVHIEKIVKVSVKHRKRDTFITAQTLWVRYRLNSGFVREITLVLQMLGEDVSLKGGFQSL
jgi:hypothetical protein